MKVFLICLIGFIGFTPAPAKAGAREKFIQMCFKELYWGACLTHCQETLGLQDCRAWCDGDEQKRQARIGCGRAWDKKKNEQ